MYPGHFEYLTTFLKLVNGKTTTNKNCVIKNYLLRDNNREFTCILKLTFGITIF